MAAPVLPIALAVFAGLIVLFQGAGKAKAAESDVDADKAAKDKAAADKAAKDKAAADKKKKTDVTATKPTGDPGDKGQRAIAAAALKNWEQASSLALADYLETGDDTAIKTVAAELKKAGLPFSSLLATLNDKAVKPALAKPKAPAPKPPAKPKDDKAAADKKAKEKADKAAADKKAKEKADKAAADKKAKEKADKAAADKKAKEKADKAAADKKAKEKAAEKAEHERELLAEAVAEEIESTKKGQEDQELIKDYQGDAGLKVDGEYGPKTAKSVWLDGVELAPNPRYWPTDWAAAKSDYKDFLTAMLAKYPDDHDGIAKLKKAV